MNDDFLGNSTWAPQGFVSQADERDMYYASVTRNISMCSVAYSYNVCYSSDPYRSDEVYGGDAFQYIPTETQVGAAIALKNMAEAGELPIQSNDPGMTQLLQSLYQRTAQFWQELRQASGTGW